MAPGFRNCSPLGRMRSYCVTTRGGQRLCGPYGYVEHVIRERIAAGEDPATWYHEEDPMEQRLLEEIEGRMRQEAIALETTRVAQLRASIVQVANREYDNWHDPDITETQAAGRPLVREYWRVGVGRVVSNADAGSVAWQADNPWSSAFVSYVMREAGAGTEFQYAWAHAVYARAAIDNRLNNSPNTFKGYRLNERALEPGDIVVTERDNSGANYDNVRRGMLTHGDIITELQAGQAIAIGGNVNQNVDRKQLAIDAGNHLTEADYFVVIKLDPVLPPPM